MLVLGISAYHGDSAAALLADGRAVAAVEEERFRRVKHWAGFPRESIAYCLASAGADLDDVDHVAVSRDPRAQLLRKAAFVLARRTPWRFLADRLKNRRTVLGIHRDLANAFGAEATRVRGKLCQVEHHLAHAASAFHFSPFDRAAVLSVDAFGDWTSTMLGSGQGADIRASRRVFFPHSMGVVYTALTQFLGFMRYGDEYKVMGLAPYGEPRFGGQFDQMVRDRGEGTFALNLKYFLHQTGRVAMYWMGDNPGSGLLFSPRMAELLGPPRRPGEPLTQRHKDIAASLQEWYEGQFFSLLRALHRITGRSALCLSGGCAMNSVANGKVLEETPFREVYVPPQPGDAGGAIGAAACVSARLLGRRPEASAGQAFLGPEFNNGYLRDLLDRHAAQTAEVRLRRVDGTEALCRQVAEDIAEGKVVGWFQGRMEWGPRALGNRSILADPRRADMKDILNLKIKRRESFRPFAPSVLREHVHEYFETTYDVPFMSMVFQIRPEKRSVIPAVTHVNGSGRLQTVDRDDNELYWRLIRAFADVTGVPVVLNTSFNENEPIVCTPEEALDCFLRTKMDTLVLGSYVLQRADTGGA